MCTSIYFSFELTASQKYFGFEELLLIHESETKKFVEFLQYAYIQAVTIESWVLILYTLLFKQHVLIRASMNFFAFISTIAYSQFWHECEIIPIIGVQITKVLSAW